MSRTPERLDPPRVTVLMAVYNGQDHVRQAVEGILAQTFSDFEFIIVDDGSTDETSRELDAFTDSRIVRLKHESNRGLIAALNTGLAAARGEFVARQDADDFSYPGRLQAQVNFLEARSDVAVVGTDTVFEGWEGGGRTNRIVERDPLRLAWILLFYCPLTHSSIMFRTAVIQEVGGYNGDDVHAEDFGLWARATRSSRVASCDRHARPPTAPPGKHHGAMERGDGEGGAESQSAEPALGFRDDGIHRLARHPRGAVRESFSRLGGRRASRYAGAPVEHLPTFERLLRQIRFRTGWLRIPAVGISVDERSASSQEPEAFARERDSLRGRPGARPSNGTDPDRQCDQAEPGGDRQSDGSGGGSSGHVEPRMNSIAVP